MNQQSNQQRADVYETIPTFQTDHFLLRAVEQKDARDLLAVYSDPLAWPLFNADNCHGDLFHYDTLEKMQGAIEFWQQSYEGRWFVRWSIVEKESSKAIGTIECFHRDGEDFFYNTGLLRLDLHSKYETEAVIGELAALLLDELYQLFDCTMIATKIVPQAGERIKAFRQLGFAEAEECLIGEGGTRYYDYYYIKR